MAQNPKKPRRGGPPKSLATHTARLTRPLFRKRGFADGAVIENWETIVGAHLAAHTVPEKITYPQGRGCDGTLHLRIESGALALELQHLGPIVVERVNGYFGYGAIKALKLTQAPLLRRTKKGPAEPPPLNARERKDLDGMIGAVEDPELAERLRSLGEAMTRRRKAEKSK